MRLVPVVAASLLAAASAARAEPATPEGAKALAASYAAYLSQAALDKGLVTVTPEGEDYVVSWDIAKALDLPESVLKTSPFAYRITPKGKGWSLRANALPNFVIGPTGESGREGGTVTFDGFKLEGLYDPAAAEIFAGKLGLDQFKADLKLKSGNDLQHMILGQSASAGEIRVRPGVDADTVDVRMSQSAANAQQKVAILGEGDAATPLTDTTQGAATGADAITGLRAKAFGDLWRYLIAHADKDKPTPEELKPMLSALLPLWRELSGRIDLDDLAVSFPGGSVKFKTIAEEIKTTGLVEHASFAMAMAFRDVVVELESAPDWVKQALPATLALDIEAGVDGLDAAAKLALDDAQFLKSGDLSENAKTEIMEVLKEGKPHLRLSHTRFATPLVEATFEGEATFEDETPDGHMKVTADSLDKVLATLAKLTETQPEAQQYLYLATFVRGLAKSENGRLVWNLEYAGPNAVKVNGQLFPPKTEKEGGGADKEDDDKE